MSERRKDDTIIAKKVGSIIEKRVGNYLNNIMLQNISHENGEIPANIGGYEKIRIDGECPNSRMKLHTMGELAEAIGASVWFIRMMKRAGFPMPASMSTPEWAFEWLKAHPEFSPSCYQLAGSPPDQLHQGQTDADIRFCDHPFS